MGLLFSLDCRLRCLAGGGGGVAVVLTVVVVFVFVLLEGDDIRDDAARRFEVAPPRKRDQLDDGAVTEVIGGRGSIGSLAFVEKN